MLTVSQIVTEHPLEIKQEDKVPELAKTIRDSGIWPRHRLFGVFWSPAGTRDGSRAFNASSQDTLLGGAAKRVELSDGSRLNVIDDTDLTDFVYHHAWFEGDEGCSST